MRARARHKHDTFTLLAHCWRAMPSVVEMRCCSWSWTLAAAASTPRPAERIASYPDVFVCVCCSFKFIADYRREIGLMRMRSRARATLNRSIEHALESPHRLVGSIKHTEHCREREAHAPLKHTHTIGPLFRTRQPYYTIFAVRPWMIVTFSIVCVACHMALPRSVSDQPSSHIARARAFVRMSQSRVVLMKIPARFCLAGRSTTVHRGVGSK